MFSNQAVAAYFAIGFGGWAFYKFQRMNGNNTVESLVAAVAVGIVSFIGLYILLGAFGVQPGTESNVFG